MLSSLDAVLSTEPMLMLGPWIAAARATAAGRSSADLLEYNARNQLTLWGPAGQIRDYARKQWGGLGFDETTYAAISMAPSYPPLASPFPSSLAGTR